MGEWHPMSEAPRDGREILTVFFDDMAGLGWVYQVAETDEDGITLHDGHLTMSWAVAGYMRWQPLPEPPETLHAPR